MKKMSRKKRQEIEKENLKKEVRMDKAKQHYEMAVLKRKSEKKFMCFHNINVDNTILSTVNNETGICEICGCTDELPVYVSDGVSEKISREKLLDFSKENLEKYILYEIKGSVKSDENYRRLEVEYNHNVGICYVIRSWSSESLISFSEILLNMIKEKNLKSPDVYKRANVDAKLFSKILNDPEYHPGKTTVLALAVAMKLDLSETEQFLREAGYAFSPNILSDIIVKYYIETKHYDIDEINQTLYKYDLKLLGSSVRK